MSHFITLVISKTGTEDEVARLLAPFDENGDWFADGSRWDWWVIGGRATGLLDDYDPNTDLRNIETCDLCGGTGDRATWRNEPREVQHPSGCNGCEGKGARVKWPTQWVPHDGDTMAVADVRPVSEWRYPPLAVLTPDGEWHEQARSGWFGSTQATDEHGNEPKPAELWPAAVQALVDQHPDFFVTVVDCHV